MHDIAQAWTGIGAAIYGLWQHTKVASSTWTMLGVISYLACISTLQTASTAVMQFTVFNSNSTCFVQSKNPWPNATTFVDGSWANTFASGLPSRSLLSSIQTIGLLNNTLYDILTTIDSSFTQAIVNTTSLQSNCGLLSNLAFSNLGQPNLSFSDNGFGSAYFILNHIPDFQGKFSIFKITYCRLLTALYNLAGILPSVHSQITRNQIVLLKDYTNSNVGN